MYIELENVKIRYGLVVAVKGVSLEVKSGTVATLIGSNGAGKSSVLRGISGLTPVSDGEIRFMGERIDNLKTTKIVRLGIAHCPEGRRVFPRMTVLQNLNLGAYLQSDAKRISETRESVLERFPILKKRSKQRAGTLSGGEQQMLAIGRALMANPKLLLLDEPSLGLSPLLVNQIAEIIKLINEQGVGIILVEQNASMALELADWSFVLETGKIVLDGPGSELKDNDMVKEAYLGG